APPTLNFENLKPCLAELLRTCVHPPALVLQVEHVLLSGYYDHDRTQVKRTKEQSQETNDNNPDAENDTQQTTPLCVRLALSDGELQIQAVIATKIHTKELLELRRGDLLEVKKFQVKKAPRVNGHGKVVYLGIKACEWAGTTREFVDKELGGGFILGEDQDQTFGKEALPTAITFPFRHVIDSAATRTLSMGRKRSREPQGDRLDRSKRRPPEDKRAVSKLIATPARPKVRFATPSGERDDSDDDDFETIITSPSTIQRRREGLRDVSQNTPSRAVTTSRSFQLFDGKGTTVDVGGSAPPASPGKAKVRTRQKDQQSRVGFRSSNIDDSHLVIGAVETQSPTSAAARTDHPLRATETPLPPLQPPSTPALSSKAPVHSLSTLLHSHTVPRRNYTCSVFGVISWISPSVIQKPSSPFPPKRHVKIHDPSISSRRAGVTLAVYVDAKAFVPEVGTLALFQGVTMQRWEGEVILNAYAKLKDSGEEWFVSDCGKLEEMGFDVHGLKSWWAEHKETQATCSS
ncbi:uncharacterized protein A1O9_04045, partial [Exophiala aquamarina CBS 119918]